MKKEIPVKRKVDRHLMEKEDAGLLKMMNEGDDSKTVSRSKILKKLSKKVEIMEGLKEALDQVNRSKQGLVKLNSIRELLDEL